MNLIVNKTQFIHKTFGTGTLAQIIPGGLVKITFEGIGNKVFLLKTLESGLLKLVEESEPENINYEKPEIIKYDKSEVVEYDKSETIISNNNIIEAKITNNEIIFNESYTVIGEVFKAKSVHANYDLTVIGDLDVTEISVKGKLVVIGDIIAKDIKVEKAVVCNGVIKCERLFAGESIIADSINSIQIDGGNNLLVNRALSTSEVYLEKSLIAGEGVIVDEKFSAENGIAIEYFEIYGQSEGLIFETSNGIQIGEKRIDSKMNCDMPLNEIIDLLNSTIKQQIVMCGDEGEEKLLELTRIISESNIPKTDEWFIILPYLIEISYLEEIVNFRDYLLIVYVKKFFPDEIINYETLEHIFNDFHVKVDNKVGDMEFAVKSISELELSLRIINAVSNVIPLSKEEAYEKIFQSIGIKYTTVQSFFK